MFGIKYDFMGLDWLLLFLSHYGVLTHMQFNVHTNIISFASNLVKHATADWQRAGVGEQHLLFIGIIEEAPLKLQQRSFHHNLRNNTPINREKERGGKKKRSESFLRVTTVIALCHAKTAVY